MEPRGVPTSAEPLSAEASAEILARIDAREREIERALHEAREAAASIVQTARDKAQQIVTARHEEATRAAAERGARIEAESRRAADEILSGGAREAADIRAISKERIARAAEGLLAVVLPPAPPGGGAR